MQPDPLNVTFAVICHHYSRYLRRAIESCLIQKAPPGIQTQVLVLDDASTDETLEICAKYERSILVSRSINLGLGATLTRAVREAKGDWIFFLDADDYFAPTKLTAFLPHFYQGGILLINDQPSPIAPPMGQPLVVVLERGCISTLAVLRKPALDLLPVENELYLHVLARPGKKVTLPDTHTFCRLHHANMTNKRSSPGVWNSYMAYITHGLADRLEKISSHPPAWLGTTEETRSLAWDYRVRAWYHELQFALECKLWVRAWGRWFRMVSDTYRSGKSLGKLHWKMLLRTIVLKG